VLETLEQVLAEQEDEILQGLHVLAVDPAPDDSHLLVTVAPGPGIPARDGATILGRLAEAAPELRIEVASSITRRRAPSFSFQLGALTLT
jgi:ribosome-binding factor A